MNKKVVIINGPNLNMLGKREPEIYGSDSLEDIKEYTTNEVKKLGHLYDMDWFQSNLEGEIVEKIQSIVNDSSYEGLIINPAGYTHSSVAIFDALKMLKIPVIEVHLSNTHHREEFREKKVTTKASTIVIEGSGINAYFLGLLSLIYIKRK